MNQKQSNTKELIRKIKDQLRLGRDPVDVLENVFKGRSVLVISAGPSCVQWKEVYENEKVNNPIVVCVKQAKLEVGDICDVHFLNNANFRKYKKDNDCLSVMTNNGTYLPMFGSYDVNYIVMPKLVSKERYYLAKNKNFENYELNSTGIYRPPGPGIMYESVIYTLLHMGVSRIVTIGWDIADDKGGNTHFDDTESLQLDYHQSEKQKNIQRIKSQLHRYGMLKLVYRIRASLHYIIAFFKYYMGGRINAANMLPNEAELVSKSIPELKAWLGSKNISILIRGGSRWMR